MNVVVGLGELLWDLLPEGARLGGAPANFTVMAARLGHRGVVASRLGAQETDMDDWGSRARTVLSGFPVDASLIQSDTDHPTGTVDVEFRNGEPHYVIHEPVAWDFLAWTPEWQQLAQQADAVCFGSLAQRSQASRKTIHRFLAATRPECVRVFDVNLRAPYFSAEIVTESLERATIFKLNESEVPQVLAMLGGTAPVSNAGTDIDETALHAAADWLLERFPLKLVAITLGGEGSLLVSREGAHRRQGIRGPVADTVGAGDAFTAAMVDAYLRGAGLARMNEAGNRWGGWVASQHGAMPALSAETYTEIQNNIAEVE
ncbi:carbohydrate kinase family protein [Silvibacterium dinghuense]|uniref:Carbohydrate kinase n=1 Tax=Silvibacterium dinghuense TaxID=1560006 RepID=A0A4Q1SJ94_9BACT|nr:carbohydrate kinase [Silvibacterium dinghuense]RXS97696.1 carbohydrate kinase [Silvibacterium dinghuense]GGH01244.1 fructokinase [Silvibacterium dinghuense]